MILSAISLPWIVKFSIEHWSVVGAAQCATIRHVESLLWKVNFIVEHLPFLSIVKRDANRTLQRFLAYSIQSPKRDDSRFIFLVCGQNVQCRITVRAPGCIVRKEIEKNTINSKYYWIRCEMSLKRLKIKIECPRPWISLGHRSTVRATQSYAHKIE